jgi:hypothetical protein
MKKILQTTRYKQMTGAKSLLEFEQDSLLIFIKTVGQKIGKFLTMYIIVAAKRARK